MKMGDLRAQLTSADTILVRGTLAAVYRSGKMTDTYTIGQDGELWLAEGLQTCPPSGHFKVTNLYVDKDTRKLVVEYDDTPAI